MKNYYVLIDILAITILFLQFWMPTMAMKKTNLNEFTVENQRTHMRKNYVVHRENESPDNEINIAYAAEFGSKGSPEELPALIVDYAKNMIRNDIILLDKSVETRTRKRGNMKVEKYDSVGISEIPCNCEQETEVLVLGEDYIPNFIETRRCNTDLCASTYTCQKRVYNITVLKRKKYGDKSVESLPEELSKRWVAIKKPITVACFCTSDYREKY